MTDPKPMVSVDSASATESVESDDFDDMPLTQRFPSTNQLIQPDGEIVEGAALKIDGGIPSLSSLLAPLDLGPLPTPDAVQQELTLPFETSNTTPAKPKKAVRFELHSTPPRADGRKKADLGKRSSPLDACNPRQASFAFRDITGAVVPRKSGVAQPRHQRTPPCSISKDLSGDRINLLYLNKHQKSTADKSADRTKLNLLRRIQSIKASHVSKTNSAASNKVAAPEPVPAPVPPPPPPPAPRPANHQTDRPGSVPKPSAGLPQNVHQQHTSNVDANVSQIVGEAMVKLKEVASAASSVKTVDQQAVIACLKTDMNRMVNDMRMMKGLIVMQWQAMFSNPQMMPFIAQQHPQMIALAHSLDPNMPIPQLPMPLPPMAQPNVSIPPPMLSPPFCPPPQFQQPTPAPTPTPVLQNAQMPRQYSAGENPESQNPVGNVVKPFVRRERKHAFSESSNDDKRSQGKVAGSDGTQPQRHVVSAKIADVSSSTKRRWSSSSSSSSTPSTRGASPPREPQNLSIQKSPLRKDQKQDVHAKLAAQEKGKGFRLNKKRVVSLDPNWNQGTDRGNHGAANVQKSTDRFQQQQPRSVKKPRQLHSSYSTKERQTKRRYRSSSGDSSVEHKKKRSKEVGKDEAVDQSSQVARPSAKDWKQRSYRKKQQKEPQERKKGGGWSDSSG